MEVKKLSTWFCSVKLRRKPPRNRPMSWLCWPQWSEALSVYKMPSGLACYNSSRNCVCTLLKRILILMLQLAEGVVHMRVWVLISSHLHELKKRMTTDFSYAIDSWRMSSISYIRFVGHLLRIVFGQPYHQSEGQVQHIVEESGKALQPTSHIERKNVLHTSKPCLCIGRMWLTITVVVQYCEYSRKDVPP